MTRSRRVRELPTEELVQEVADLFCRLSFEGELSSSEASRWSRCVREIARRDYRFRSHGRTCQCEDCWAMLETWVTLRRRVGADITDFVPQQT